ncbi:MAG: hypothetical protein Q8K70_08845 [Bacteroidota bacterium]|nr:hypothetical protein [Bacteroidota bacterium]
MKQTIYIFIFAFGLLSFHNLFGQKVDGNNIEPNCQNRQTYLTSMFDNFLIELKSNDSLEKFKTAIDSMKKEWSKSDSSNIRFSLSDKWNLFYFQFSGSEHHFVPSGIPLGIDINRCYNSTNKDTVFTSKQIFCEFNIGDSISLKDYPLKYFPTIYERVDEFNAKWTAILPNSEYLIIRMVHSYPNGNATSWYKERTYYFSKAKN